MYAMEEMTLKPAWGWLYGVVAAMGGVLAVIEVTIPDGAARRALECIVALAMFGAMAIWVRANRVALALDGDASLRPPRPATAGRGATRKHVA